MDFYQIITLLFSFLGLMNGLFAAGLFRLKRFYLYGIAGALISCGAVQYYVWYALCLLYTSDAADEEDSVDLGGSRTIKKKKK